MDEGDLEIAGVTADRWADLVDLFERRGPRGAWPRTSACYCMFWRLQPADYEAAFRRRSLENRSGGPNKAAMKRLVAGGGVPGLLAYRDGRPVGWASLAPRSELVRLEYSPQLRSEDAVDDERTWSIACLYVERAAWRTGVGTALLAASVERAIAQGATAVEGYPVTAPSVDPYTGYDTMFARAGFRLVRPGRGRGRALWQKRLSPDEKPARAQAVLR
jgi:GNAT superfamily N-acetyltransferase